jgi:molybdate transport system ATP-binding protein
MQLLQVNNLTISRDNKTILNNVNFNLNQGENLLISGCSGSGKTSLGLALAGKLFYKGIIHLGITNKDIIFIPQFYKFKDKSGMSDFYYQQRYNSIDADDCATVKDILGIITDDILLMLTELNLLKLLNSPLIQLSSGERKKLQLIESLTKSTKLLILDNPYIGLDITSITHLNKLFIRLSDNGISLIILGDVDKIPAFISTVGIIQNSVISFTPANLYNKPLTATPNIEIKNIPPLKETYFNIAVRLENINVSYANKQVLQNINWQINKGEKWLLQGANGAGKSTLLSLINGDHPQSYANDIYLFDKKRGSGESIWDVKHKIGFMSPELHWNFNYSMTSKEVVVSGLYDTLGLYKKPKPEEEKQAIKYMNLLGLATYIDNKFNTLSSGIQRMLLLARALVKNPPLLILDEPCQGLDRENSSQFIALIDSLFADSSHTIIYVSHQADQIPKCINNTFAIEMQQ